MDRFTAFTVFVTVAEQRSFAQASRLLGMSPPVITRAIAALEQRYEVALFRRSTRTVVVTDEGLALLERVRTLLQDLRETEQLMIGGQSDPRGELNLTAPVMFGRMHVLPVVAALLDANPALTAKMMLIDRNVRIVEEGIDVAVRIGHLEDSSLTRIKIGEVRQTIVGSPAYFDRRSAPSRPADLAHHVVVAGDNVRATNQWKFGPRGKTVVAVTPRITVNSLDAVLAAARGGLGLANALSYQVIDDIERGLLVPVLEEHALPAIPVQLIFPANRSRLPSVRSFIQAMQQCARSKRWI